MKKTHAISTILTIGFLVTAFVSSAWATETTKEEQAMTVSSGKQVSIEYTLTLGDQQVVDTNVGGNPLTFVQGEHQIISGLEKALEGMKAGDEKKVEVAPEEAYGPVIPEAEITVQSSQLPDEAKKVGAMVQGKGPQGQVLRGKVTGIEEEKATIDFNHPLAGKTLFFDVKVLSVQNQ